LWRVPSLSLPPIVHGPAQAGLSLPSTTDPQTSPLMESEAVRLFVQRAVAAMSGFRLTAQNAAATAQVCRQLDGIPLALELAAARLKVLPVEQIAARLDDRFRLLTGGSRTALPRQQTLRALIDWSYDLLSEPERALLRHLSGFAGGWTLEAAEAVGSGQWAVGSEVNDSESELTTDHWPPPTDVLDLLTSLVDKSLVIYDEQAGAGRYRLLETVRQYGRGWLLEAGKTA